MHVTCSKIIINYYTSLKDKIPTGRIGTLIMQALKIIFTWIAF